MTSKNPVQTGSYASSSLREDWSSFGSAPGWGGGDDSRGAAVAGGSAGGVGVDGFGVSLLPPGGDSVEAAGDEPGVLGSEPGATGVLGNRSARSVYWLNCSISFFRIASASSGRPAWKAASAI